MTQKSFFKNRTINVLLIEFLIVFIMIIIDQLVKFQVENHISQGEVIGFIPGFIDLTFVKNTGAAFGMFSNSIVFLLIVRIIMATAIIFVLIKYDNRISLFLKISLSFILAGAFGNLIDQIFIGYVRDMFSFSFVEFAIFNVADICITLGTISLISELVFGKEKSLF